MAPLKEHYFRYSWYVLLENQKQPMVSMLNTFINVETYRVIKYIELRCQRIGHNQSFFAANPRCVKCEENPSTKFRPEKEKNRTWKILWMPHRQDVYWKGHEIRKITVRLPEQWTAKRVKNIQTTADENTGAANNDIRSSWLTSTFVHRGTVIV